MSCRDANDRSRRTPTASPRDLATRDAADAAELQAIERAGGRHDDLAIQDARPQAVTAVVRSGNYRSSGPDRALMTVVVAAEPEARRHHFGSNRKSPLRRREAAPLGRRLDRRGIRSQARAVGHRSRAGSYAGTVDPRSCSLGELLSRGRSARRMPASVCLPYMSSRPGVVRRLRQMAHLIRRCATSRRRPAGSVLFTAHDGGDPSRCAVEQPTITAAAALLARPWPRADVSAGSSCRSAAASGSRGSLVPVVWKIADRPLGDRGEPVRCGPTAGVTAVWCCRRAVLKPTASQADASSLCPALGGGAQSPHHYVSRRVLRIWVSMTSTGRQAMSLTSSALGRARPWM